DVFSPLAARLARGESPEEFGEQLIKTDLKGVLWEEPFIKEGSIFGEIIYIDKFGTACFNLKESEVIKLGFKAGGYINLFIKKKKKRVKYEKIFSSVSPGRTLLFIDSSGYLALGVNKGSALKEFGLKVGEKVVFKQNEV
ncbi:MAG: SAM-dependent chlorinase/fluorinase, partial [Actinomycetia bacterium]|nr:SAM-dependent chlorinase/fluorinase [Actinomycetes bacterium]